MMMVVGCGNQNASISSSKIKYDYLYEASIKGWETNVTHPEPKWMWLDPDEDPHVPKMSTFKFWKAVVTNFNSDDRDDLTLIYTLKDYSGDSQMHFITLINEMPKSEIPLPKIDVFSDDPDPYPDYFPVLNWYTQISEYDDHKRKPDDFVQMDLDGDGRDDFVFVYIDKRGLRIIGHQNRYGDLDLPPGVKIAKID